MMLDPATDRARQAQSYPLSGRTSNQTIFYLLKPNSITLKFYVSILYFYGCVVYIDNQELITFSPLCVSFLFNVMHLQPILPPNRDLSVSQRWYLSFHVHLDVEWEQVAAVTVIFRVLI